MIDFEEFTLENGLQVIVHEDPTVQIAVMNILYKVGSRDENEQRTGFAHLFEHLMFGGSINVPDFDVELQKVGGENNAFTSPDITNYYLTVPHQNIECGFWLESDRMLGLPFNPKVLEVQRSVVIEEFKQRYLNQPYGDVWLKLRPLAYKKHPYKWPTIGKKISHIEDATMDDVKSFYEKFYNPDNAIMVVAGNIKTDEIKRLSEKWFGEIPKGAPLPLDRTIPKEPLQKEKRTMIVEAEVPTDMLFMTFHMPGRFNKNYHSTDLLSDVLGREKSSRLYRKLVREQGIFTNLSAYVMGSLDPGLLVISGKLADGHTPENGESAVWEVIDDLKSTGLLENELMKVKNQAISTLAFGEQEVLNRAMSLAYAAITGDAGSVNLEKESILGVKESEIMTMCNDLLQESKASVMYYNAKKV